MSDKRSLPRAFRLLMVTDGVGNLARIAARVAAVLQSGPAAVMLREPQWERELVGRACQQLRPLVHDGGGLLLVNARRDITQSLLPSGLTDGLHLSQRSVVEWGGVHEARRAAGPDAWIGVSTHDEAELRAAEPAADYVTLSPVFPTESKPGKEPLAPQRVQRWIGSTSLPVVWLGGIDADRVGEAWRAGAPGIAARAELMAPDGEVRAAALRRAAYDGRAGDEVAAGMHLNGSPGTPRTGTTPSTMTRDGQRK